MADDEQPTPQEPREGTPPLRSDEGPGAWIAPPTPPSPPPSTPPAEVDAAPPVEEGRIASFLRRIQPWRGSDATDEAPVVDAPPPFTRRVSLPPIPAFESRPIVPEPEPTPATAKAIEPAPVVADEPAPPPSLPDATEAPEPEQAPLARPTLFDAPPPPPPSLDAAPPIIDVPDEAPVDTPVVGELPPPVPALTALAQETPLPDPDAETPEEQAEETREVALIASGGLFSRFVWPSHPRYWNAYLAVLTGLAALSFLVFVLVEPSPRWILLVTAGAVIVGMDGVLRATWRAAFANGEDTTPYLFLPALYVFAAPMLIEHTVTGHSVIMWALIAGLGFAAIAVAEVLSVRTGSRLYQYARMVTTGSAYFSAFSLLSMTYVLHVGLVPSLIAAWLIGTMLAIEVVREGEVDPIDTAVFAAVAGLVVAQVRWLLFFVPIDGYLAALTLVLVFYLVSGVLHSYVLRQLNAVTAGEYALVAAIGLGLVGVAKAAGLA